VVRPGGSLRSCNPGSLYAFISHTNLQPPKEFVGVWTLNGTNLARVVNTNTPEVNGATFWQVQGSPQPLYAGAYRFQLMVDGRTVTEASFTLTC
jgi:hypothetical protein